MFKNLKKLVAAVGLVAAATSSFATPSLSFIINGDTFSQPYSITNNSTGGEKVTRFSLNLATATTGGPFCFDTVSGGACNPNPQSPAAFVSVSGAAATGFTSPSSVADGSTLLDLLFGDFNAGETYSWYIDIDSATAITTYGADLIGATAFVDFSDGQRLIGQLFAVDGSPQASQFTVTGIVQIPNDVPEPGSLALLGLGLAGLAYTRKRKA